MTVLERKVIFAELLQIRMKMFSVATRYLSYSISGTLVPFVLNYIAHLSPLCCWLLIGWMGANTES